MNGRQKVEAAFSPDGTREIPAVICYEDLYIRDHWEQLTAHPWWYQQAPDVERQMAWRRDAITRTGQDWGVLPAIGPRATRSRLQIVARPDGVYRVDARTGQEERLIRPQVAGWSAYGEPESVHPGRLAETPEALDLLIPPPPPFDRAQFLAAGRADLAAQMLAEFGHERYPSCHVPSPLWLCYSLWGFEGMMSMIAARPDVVRYACKRHLARSLRAVHEAAALGAAGIWIEECLTDMISPEAFATLNLPYLRDLVDEIRALGLHSIYYYCGDPAGKWELLCDAQTDALSLEESKKGFTIDIAEVAERVGGRCTLLGNLDAIDLLPNGTEGQLRAEIARQIAAGRRNGSRFVMSLGSPVTPGTPVERVRLYCDLVHELGKG